VDSYAAFGSFFGKVRHSGTITRPTPAADLEICSRHSTSFVLHSGVFLAEKSRPIAIRARPVLEDELDRDRLLWRP
jgi:hypothetical protein